MKEIDLERLLRKFLFGVASFGPSCLHARVVQLALNLLCVYSNNQHRIGGTETKPKDLQV